MANTAELLHHVYLSIGGADAPEELMRDIEKVVVENSLHLPDVATLVIHDPHLRWVDDELLAPGKALRVRARTERDDGPIFDGEIVEVEPDFEAGTQRLTVRAFDRLHRLARGRHVRSFVNVADDDVFHKIASEVGLHARCGPMRQVHPYVFQANQTNLAFLQRRAASLGFHLFVEGETLCCVPPNQGRPVANLEWGKSLAEFRPRLTTIGQVNRVSVRGWDPAQRTEIVGEADHTNVGLAIGLSTGEGGELARNAFRIDAPFQVADRPVRSQTAADQLAQAAADRYAGRFVEADALCGGNPQLVAGVTVALRGVGKRFGGNYTVTSTAHTYSETGYTTALCVSGLHPTTLLSLLAPEPTEVPTTGLVIGIVTDNQDPDGWGRVKVRYPWLSAEHTSDWARVVVPGGGGERGIAFLPEIDDEVLVGFELGDMHFPYVLGGLWNGVDRPPRSDDELVAGGQVQRRVVRSRTGHTIIFDDGDAGGVTITDRAGNTVHLDSDQRSVTIKASGDLTLEAGGIVTVKGNEIHLN